MASADPGMILAAAPAEDSRKADMAVHSPTASINENPVAPDQFDPKWETDKVEKWSYYGYYIGANGLSLFNFGPTAFQNLMYQAAPDQDHPVLKFAGR